MEAIEALDDMEATEVADMFVQSVVDNAPDGDFVTVHGKNWLHYTVDVIEVWGPEFVRKLAAAVYTGRIEVLPTADGIGFRGI